MKISYSENKNIKMRKIIYILFICVLLISCSKQKSNTKNVERINCTENKIEESLDISDKFDIKPVVLETTQESLIGRIKKVMVYKNRIYVFDQLVSKSLFVFNLDGDFLFKISPYGRGKGEAMYLTNFDIFDEDIYFLSSLDRKILDYDINGNFVKEIRLEDFGNFNLKVFSKKLFFTGGCSHGTLMDFWNENGKKIKEYKNENRPKQSRGTFKELSVLKDTLFVNIPLNDTIWRVTEDKKVNPAFIFDFGEKRFPIEKMATKEEVRKAKKKNCYFTLESITISNNYIFANFGKDHSFTFFIYNRKTHKSLETKNINYDGIGLFLLKGDYPNGFIFVSTSFEMDCYVNRAKKYKGNNDKIINIKPEDNPVLFIVTEKKGNEK